MKLRNRLFIRIIIVLLLQIALTLGVVIYTFTEHVRSISRESLNSAWRDARLAFEQLKHELYLNIHFVSYLIRTIPREDLLKEGLDNPLYQYYNSSRADIMYVKNGGERLLFHLKSKDPSIPHILNLIQNRDFRFARNKYIVSENGADYPRVFLVTGITLKTDVGALYHVFLVNQIDSRFLNSIFQETGLNLGIFYGRRYVTASMPAFEYPAAADGEFSVSLGQTPYQGYAGTIEYGLDSPLNLVVLKSGIRDQLYINDVIKNILLIFIVGLVFSFVLAIGMTAQVVGPLARLNNWMNAYFKSRALPPLFIYPKDEIGFLAETFHNMVVRIIKEEQIINNQLKEITFLNRYNELVAKNLQAGVLVVSADESIEYANPYVAALLQADTRELLGRNINTVLTDHFNAPAWETDHFHLNLKKENHISDIRLKSPGEEQVMFVAKLIPLEAGQARGKCLIVLEDITKTEHLWQKILVSEKIASLGLITAGLAHEINNPLGSILSHVQFLGATTREKEKLDSVNWIKKEAGRIADLVSRVLDFARQDSSEAADLNAVVNEILELLSHDFARSNIRIDISLYPEKLTVKIDPDSLKQAIINIVMNARQAMSRGGRLVLATGCDQTGCASIRVEDNGEGIDTRHLKDIFSPFFTTKQKKGVGLGLCITYSIIERAGGDITIRSRKNEGTVVDIHIPLVQKKEDEE